MISVVSDRCPVDPDETAEAYLLERLPKEQAAAFEQHYIGCSQCGERLQFTQDFVVAVRKAAERLKVARAAAM